MNKLDMSVLPDGFLIEESSGNNRVWKISFVSDFHRNAPKFLGLIVRPILKHWHFNDGSLTLPKGLICEFYHSNGSITKDYSYRSYAHYQGHAANIIAVKILGLAEGYEHEGMEVVKL